MALIHPDFARRVDLAGVGPCPRPVDIDQARTGFASLVSLRVYAFAEGMVIDGEAEADEVFVVLMRGAAEIAVASAGQPTETVALHADTGMRVVYMPPHAVYRLTAMADCDIAYARAAAVGTLFPPTCGFALSAERLAIAGYAVGMDLALATVQAGARVELAQGGSPERFVHVRSRGAMQATIAGQPLGDWDTVTLGEGDDDVLLVATGVAEVLIVATSQFLRGISPGISKVVMNA